MAFVLGGEHRIVTGRLEEVDHVKAERKRGDRRIRQRGSYLKVSAVVLVAMIEVSIVGNPMSEGAMLIGGAI
jgi:hypothetical protein